MDKRGITQKAITDFQILAYDINYAIQSRENFEEVLLLLLALDSAMMVDASYLKVNGAWKNLIGSNIINVGQYAKVVIPSANGEDF